MSRGAVAVVARFAVFLAITVATGLFLGDFQLAVLAVVVAYLLDRNVWHPPR